MNKPNTMKDLMAGGHISLSDVQTIAREIFDGKTTGFGPEGYMVTASNFDDLATHVQGFVVKAILEFRIENVLDAVDAADAAEDERQERADTEAAESRKKSRTKRDRVADE